MSMSHMLHDGSPWLLLSCLLMLVGVIVGVFTNRGSGIAEHPFSKAGTGGALASDLPAESIGRPGVEPLLWGRRRRRRR